MITPSLSPSRSTLGWAEYETEWDNRREPRTTGIVVREILRIREARVDYFFVGHGSRDDRGRHAERTQ